MKKKVFVFMTIISIILIVSIPVIYYFIHDKDNNETNKDVMGVWWWDDNLNTDVYLKFAVENGINEIYYCSSEFGEETSMFIDSANKLGIAVYWLQGEYGWLDNSTPLQNKIEKYLEYQTNYSNTKFSGIHLDIEPHQNPDFEYRRKDLMLKLIELADFLNKTYFDVSFDYDIPFWFDDDIVYKNLNRPAYQHIIDIADRVFIMSYRDTADSIIDIASDEIAYAQSVGKEIILSVECSSDEGDEVSFIEEGRNVLKEELRKIKQILKGGVGLSIHHIKSFYDMKD